MESLFHGIITSKMRIKILMRLFINPESKAYLRELADEFSASPSQVKEELDQLRSAKLLVSKKNGRQVLFSANRKHPIYNELHSMVSKTLGVDTILDSILIRLGNLEKAYLIEDYAKGKDTGIIDLILVGDIDNYHLNDLTQKTERYIKRKIRHLVLSKDEFVELENNLKTRGMMLLWEKPSAESISC